MDDVLFVCLFVFFPRLIECFIFLLAGGSVQPAVRAAGAPVQEAVCRPLSGLRQERQCHAGRLRGPGAVPDGGPDAGLRSVHISKCLTRLVKQDLISPC